MFKVGQVLNIRDALDALLLNQLLYLLDDLLGADHIRQLSDDDAFTASRHLLDSGRGALLQRTAPRLVSIADPLEADDFSSGGEVGARDEPH